MSLQAMSFGNRAVNGHGTVTTITGQGNKSVSRGSSEEPLAPTYPGKIGKTFYVETEESSAEPPPFENRGFDASRGVDANRGFSEDKPFDKVYGRP